MSDIFNHEYEAFDFEGDQPSDRRAQTSSCSCPSHFSKDRYFYHRFHAYKSIVRQTPAAMLVEFTNGLSWVPKKLIGKINPKAMQIHQCYTFSFLDADIVRIVRPKEGV